MSVNIEGVAEVGTDWTLVATTTVEDAPRIVGYQQVMQIAFENCGDTALSDVKVTLQPHAGGSEGDFLDGDDFASLANPDVAFATAGLKTLAAQEVGLAAVRIESQPAAVSVWAKVAAGSTWLSVTGHLV